MNHLLKKLQEKIKIYETFVRLCAEDARQEEMYPEDFSDWVRTTSKEILIEGDPWCPNCAATLEFCACFAFEEE